MKGRLWITLGLCTFGTGCATGAPAGALMTSREARYRPYLPSSPARAVPTRGSELRPVDVSPDARERVVAAARRLVGANAVRIDGQTYPSDCTGLVQAVYGHVGVHLLGQGAEAGDNGVTAIYRYAQRTGRIFHGGWPLPGDIVFFRETYDQNRDGRANDGLTHVGIVEEVRRDGTVNIIHRVDRGVVRYRMNLDRPTERRDSSSGLVLNDALKSPSGGKRERLTAELFAGYATLLPSGQPTLVSR